MQPGGAVVSSANRTPVNPQGNAQTALDNTGDNSVMETMDCSFQWHAVTEVVAVRGESTPYLLMRSCSLVSNAFRVRAYRITMSERFAFLLH